MKKMLLKSTLIAGITFFTINTSFAIDLKSINLSSVKNNVASEAISSKSAVNDKYKKEYQAKIEAQAKAVNNVKDYEKQAKMELAKVILSSEQIEEIKKLGNEEQENKLNDELIAVLTDEAFLQTYGEYTDIQKKAYISAVTKIKIADNRYKNVSNQLTAPLKQIVDGNVSAISTKDELKNAGAMIFGIKKNLVTNVSLNKAINKVNKKNDIVVVVPDSERVIYPKEGTIGSINAQIDEINIAVNKANKTIANILLTKEQIDSLKAIQNNSNLSAEEKDIEGKKLAGKYIKENNTDGTITNRFSELTNSQKDEYKKAVQTIINSAASYAGIAVGCTKLGLKISKNPLIAAPLVFELGALKDTGSLVKTSASDLTKSLTQIKKINKENSIEIVNVNETTVSKLKNVGNLKGFSKK